MPPDGGAWEGRIGLCDNAWLSAAIVQALDEMYLYGDITVDALSEVKMGGLAPS